MEPMFEKAAILGLGLLGGSLAKAGKKLGLIGAVAGCGRTEKRLEFALANGIADTIHKDPAEAVRGAGLVVVCTPVGTAPAMLEAIAPHLEKGALVTDVGSTKRKIVERAEAVLPESVYFVGGHPMAGSENSGVEAATDTLFENAICALTSSSGTNMMALNRLEKFWTALKAKVLVVSPAEHDLLVAASSHLPHMVAVALTRCVAGVSENYEKVIPLLAGGFRDTTRIASGSPEMWRDICLENRESIAAVLEDFIRTASETAELIKRGDSAELAAHLSRAKTFRDELPSRGRGILEPVHEILVDVSDKPGIIGEIATTLGRNHINLRNINVQHVREFQGGTLSVILEKDADIDRAISLLKERGFAARPRE